MKLRRLFLATVLTLATGAVLAQGGLEGVDWDGVDPSGQTVTFWHQHTQERETALQEIIREFNETNEYGITVVAEYQGGYGDIFQKMLALLGTSDTPNIVVAYQNQAATYQLVDGLVDLNPLVESERWGLSEEDIADFFPGFSSSDVFPSFEDKRLGIAPNRSMEMLYYNIDWLAELRAAGHIDFDGPPTTPEQFRQAACAATENPFSGATATGPSVGYELASDASRFASWTFAFGGDVFDYENGRFTYDSPAAVEAMTFLQELFAAGCGALTTEAFGDQTNFGAGRTLFTVGSSSGLPFYASAVSEGAGHEWSVAAIPHTTPEPVMNIYGASVSLPAGHTPEETLAAWVFLKYYTGTEAQAAWAAASQYFPVRQSVAANLGPVFEEVPGYEVAFNLLPYGVAEPPVPGYDFVREIVTATMADIVTNPALDVQAALTDLNEEANDILEEQMAELD
ncbi:MAG TPA: extracellular solute-binding protein [Trueperaceae bacterium]|nr:extracellular solute-binding protein [Trueperaceae bacterium]